MIRRAVWGAWVWSLVGCATAPPPAAVATPSPLPPFADARPAVERPRPPRAPDPPNTRRVGVGEWSFAVGEDWEQRNHRGGRQYVLPLGDAGIVLASVGRDPRPRGPAAEAYRGMVSDLREQYTEAGLRVVSVRDTAVDGAPAVDVTVASQYAGRRVVLLTRAQVEGNVTSQVWCTAPVEGVAAARVECSRIRATLRGTDPVAAAAGVRLVQRGDVSVAIPQAWVDALRNAENSVVARSDASPDSITVELESGDLEGTASHYLSQFVQRHREAGATVVSSREGRAAGRRWVDTEVTLTFPDANLMTQRLVLHGDELFSITCAEPTAEVAAGRRRCAAVVESFRFGSP